MNYVERRRNQTQGRWFVEIFLHNETIPSLDDLKQKIEGGTTKFIQKMQYFSSTVPGSDAYWRGKRSELLSWIQHHIEVGNGAPSLFITLSCAEYHWKDIEDLLIQRRQIAGEDNCSSMTKSERIQACNDYAIVIQEYFQFRVQEFMDTIGKEVFGIHHYWLRYEFAKSRGQIHAHILTVMGKESHIQDVNKIAYDLREDIEEQTIAVDKWAHDVFGITAIHPGSNKDGTLDLTKVPSPEGTYTAIPEAHPAKSRLSDVFDISADKCHLCNTCQMHSCSSYCLRCQKKKKEVISKKRFASTVINFCGMESIESFSRKKVRKVIFESIIKKSLFYTFLIYYDTTFHLTEKVPFWSWN